MKRALILLAATAALLVCSDVSACQPVRRALRATATVGARAVRVVKAPLRVVQRMRAPRHG